MTAPLRAMRTIAPSPNGVGGAFADGVGGIVALTAEWWKRVRRAVSRLAGSPSSLGETHRSD